MKEIHNHAVKWNMDILLTCQKGYCSKPAHFKDKEDKLWCEDCLQEQATEYYADKYFGDDSFEQAWNDYSERFGVEEI